MIRINASFKDCIERIVCYNEAQPSSIKTVSRDNSDSKEDIIYLFQNCISFNIEENKILFEINKTEEEKQKQLRKMKSVVTHSINMLKKWCNTKDEWKDQIIEYLTYKNLDWIIKEII